MEPESLHVPASDGLKLRLLRWSQEGTPLLLVHGFSNEAHIWDEFAPEVAPYYQVHAIDQRGHGESDWDPESRYDYDHYVADLEAVVDHLGFERFVLIGHSLGGRVSTLFAGRHPELVAGLVVVDTGPEHDRRGITRIQMDVREHTSPSFGSPTEYELYLSRAYPAATMASIRRMARHGLRQREDGRYELKMDTAFRSQAAVETSREEMEAHEATTTQQLWDALASIPCPVLIVRGAASDILTADCADRMVEDVLQNGTLAVIPQAGHSVMTDNPDGFRDAVCSFVLGE